MARMGARDPKQLPGGRHGLSRQEVESHQRQRMLEAMVEATAEKGYPAVAVADVLRVAGVSRRTFYDQFRDKEDCFLATYDQAVERLMEDVVGAYGDTGPWPERFRDGLKAFLDYLAERPKLAKVCLVDVLAAGPTALRRYRDAVNSFLPFLEAGMAESPHRDELPALTNEAMVVTIVAIVYRRVAAGNAEGVADLLDDLLQFVLTQYLGHEAARRFVNAT